MIQDRSTSTNSLVYSKNSINMNSQQKINQKLNNENINYLSKNNNTTFQNDSFLNSKNATLQQNYNSNSNTKDTQSFICDKQDNSILQNSSNVIHKRSQSNLQMCYQTVNQNNNNTPLQQEKQKRKSQNRRQLSEMEVKKMNTLNFIQALNESQRSNNNSVVYSGYGSQMNSSVKKGNQNFDQNIYTFTKLNEIRTQLKEQKENLEAKQQQRDILKNYCERESDKFEQKIKEIKYMIMEEEESNQNQQMIIKEEPQKRQDAIKKVFINSDKLFESLQKVDCLFQRECIKNQNMAHFEEFKKQQMPILGSLEKLFQEKESIIMKIYEYQDLLENYSENRKMQQQDLEGYELRNIELALEYDDLEAYIEMLKQNEDDCQILQQINLRNVWMCLQNELNKLNLKMQEVQQNYNILDAQSRAIEKDIEHEVKQAKDLISIQEQSITPKEKVDELSCREYIKSTLNDLGKSAYEEIEFLYDGKNMGKIICEESYKQDDEQISIFQNKMMNLVKSFQQILVDEFSTYCNKYNNLQYNGEPELQFINTKKQLLSNIQLDYQNSKLGQILDRMLDLNSLFSRIIANCKQSEDAIRVQKRIVEILSIKKQSFSNNFEEQKIFCNLKYKTDQKNEELIQIQNEKLILMAKLDQMKNRNKELLYEIEKQEQNTIPFFTTENQVNHTFTNERLNCGAAQTKRSNCDDSYIFDDTTGYLNKTKITQTNNQYLITALNDSHLNYTTTNNNVNNISQINQSNSILNNSHITLTSYNNNTKQLTTLTARSNSNNQSFFYKSATKQNPNCGSQRSLSPSPSTSQINKKQVENRSQSAHYQAQYERKTQVDKIFIRMCQIKVQKDVNNRYIREIIAASEKENPKVQQLEYQTKVYTNELLHLNGMQKDHAEKLTQIYHRFFDDQIENFIRKLEGFILIQQQVPLNEFTPALNFFFTRETLTPIAKLKLLQKKMDDLKAEQENLLSDWIQQMNNIEKEIIVINQNIHHIQILYSKYDVPLIEGNSSSLFYNQASGGFVPVNSFQSSSSSSQIFANGRGEVIHHDQSLNLSDIEGSNGTAQKHNRTNSSLTAIKQHQAFCNNNSLLQQQQFGSSMFSKENLQNYNNYSSPQQNQYAEKCEYNDYSNNRYASNLSQKLKIHNGLIDQSIYQNVLEYFKENKGIQIYKMFQVNQGNLVKQQIFDPLTQKKHPQICGYGLRKLSVVNDELIFYNQKNQAIDLAIKIKDFTNIFIHPVTLEIIKYQTMNPSNKMLERRCAKKFLDAMYYPFAFEVKQTGRIECLCDNYQSLKQIYTLFVSVLQGQEQFNAYNN
ncbi:hypothetical protein TTHERM_01105010 (macronuclear) [Tetrahymena thermophila SB210]|uniref:Uncharacterized protein n=1 Tax=Tetrahymena thermophila (strain SB210) TaxID=312017 RepID=Q24D58_TETTS|nr:hypothetical protein TTHERM_01105010 [Tetrahymena thermophila SB210]EAS05731.1 hypothetical protein TTHERM_01105010 [Tetrahymena thermophila SB210]|eukprot:XP_001025976.1 hypothetical protein TTHERM_01105010 [Tetrahymena thermophila SB210]